MGALDGRPRFAGAPFPRKQPGYKLELIAARWHRRHLFLFLRLLCDHRLGGDERARYGCGVVQGSAYHLRGIHDSAFDQVFELLCGGVETICRFAIFYFVQHHGSVRASIGGNPAERLLQGFLNDANSRLFVIRNADICKGSRGANESDPPPGTIPSSTAARVAWSAFLTVKGFFVPKFCQPTTQRKSCWKIKLLVHPTWQAATPLRPTLEVDLPGVAKEGLGARVENNLLTIRGQAAHIEPGDRVYRE